MERARTSVAIVGAGPVGVSLACLLRQQGVSVEVYEMRSGLHRDPQAHVVNTRTMEVFREIGCARAVTAAAAPVEKMRFITWWETLAGRELGAISLLEVSDPLERLQVSPALIANIAQNVLEPILVGRFQELGGRINFGHEVEAVESFEDGARLRIRIPGGLTTVDADYVVACDGSRSSLRRAAGIEMQGPESLQKFITVYFTANLDRYVSRRPGPLHWIVNQHVRGVLIGFDLDRTWALMCPYDAPDSPTDFSADVARAMVSKAIGDPAVDFEISSIGNWNMSAQVAACYRKERLIFAGDSAHRFPPSGGLGMNTGIQDAHNLAWKLAAVLKGRASDALLDTYESERRSIAVTNCSQSVDNAMRMLSLATALDFATSAPVRPLEIMEGECPPRDWGLDGDTPQATARRARLEDAISEQIEHFDFAGLDLGVCYEVGALIETEEVRPPADVRVYTPSTVPGARLPHAWMLERGARRSSHDICRPDSFTLLTNASGPSFRESVRVAGEVTGAPICEVRVGPGGDVEDPGGSFASAEGYLSERAVLVRPDGHVAWAGRVAEGQLTAATLTSILQDVLKAPSRVEVAA